MVVVVLTGVLFLAIGIYIIYIFVTSPKSGSSSGSGSGNSTQQSAPQPAPKPAPQSTPKPAPQPAPKSAPKSTPQPPISRCTLSNIKVGCYVEFGSYPQTADGKRKPIEWLVLEKTGNQALIISRYALDAKPYNETRTDITWERCTLRKWLNGEFLNTAFTPAQQAAIALSKVSADGNPKYLKKPGNPTKDKIFLLSIQEAERYFKSDESRVCYPTAYAKARGVWTNDTGLCWWWLRSPGNYQTLAASVLYDGSVLYSGNAVHGDCDCVRPALRINLQS